MRYDFHTHTKYSSDGWIEPKTLVKTGIKKGLSGVGVTDHNTIKGGLKAKEFENGNFEVVIGSEIVTERGEITGLFLTEEIHSNTFFEVVDEIKEQNGVVVLPHPFDDTRGNGLYPTNEDAKLVDYIETFNSRCLRGSFNDKALSYADKHDLKKIAGRDAHFSHEIGKAGVNTSTEDLYETFQRGNFKIFNENSLIINSPIINLGLTKVLKLWRKINFGSY